MLNYFSWSNKIEVAKESLFQCAGNMSCTKIFIKGANNQLEISENAKILNYDIVLKGRDNILKFEHDLTANGNYECLTMWQEEDEDKHK
jgi:hypothetical protein